MKTPPFGQAALQAARECQLHPGRSPVMAWQAAVAALFPDSPTQRDKGCPRATFLGLCEAGLVKGIPSGHYTTSESNKKYGIAAARLLQAQPDLAEDPSALWAAVLAGEEKNPNQQMHVVIALWRGQHLIVER